MLKPFQIRDLYDPSLQPDSSLSVDPNRGSISAESSHTAGWDKLESNTSNDHTTQDPEGIHASNTSPGGNGRGIIQISAHEYDETVSRNPQSSLMYMDDDDGETVTVGSSFELAQRLNEPIDSSASLSSLPGSHSPYQMITNPVHIFDIRRSRSTVDLWRSFERRTYEQIGTPGMAGPSSPRSSIVGTLPSEPPCSPEITDSYPMNDNSAGQMGQDPPRDPRTDWLLACKPPHLPVNGSAAGSNVSLENPFGDKSDPAEDGIGARKEFSKSQSSLRSMGSSHSITEEGRRQAQEAGAKFRNWQRTPTNNASSLKLAPENPWASYNKRQARFDDPVQDGVARAEPESQKTTPSSEEVNEPLLAAFEAQMSKIMEETAATQAQEHSTEGDNTDKTDDNPEPATSEREPGPSASRPPPTPADVLATAVNHMVAGATRLGSELGHRVPEIERQLSNAQGRLPDHLESTVQGGLRTIGSHIHALANASHNASFAAHQAAYRSRVAQHQAIERLVAERLRGVAGDLSNIGRTIFSSLEAGLGASRTTAHHEPSAEGSQPTANRAQATESTGVEETSNIDPSVSAKEAESDTRPKDDSLSSQPTDTVESDAQQTELPSKRDLPDVCSSKPCAGQDAGPQQPLPATAVSGNNLQERSSREGISPTTANDYRMPRATCPPAPEHGLPRRHDPSRSPLPFRALRPSPWDHGGSDYRSMTYHNTGRPQLSATETPSPPLNKTVSGSAESHPALIEPTSTLDTLFLRFSGTGVTETAIQKLLAEQGFLAKIFLRKRTIDGPGFAYLKFPSIYAARGAKEALQGVYLGGEAVFVAFSHANFDELQKYSKSKPDAPSPQPHLEVKSLQSKGREVTSANEHNLSDQSERKSLKKEPSVTFADPDDTANTTGSIKRHRSLGTFPPAWGGPFPYRRPSRPTVPKPCTKDSGLKKSEDSRAADWSKKLDDTILDLMDVDDDFSARYPSLFATQGLRRANTISSLLKQNSPSKAAANPESEMERFPTVSQLEAESQAKHRSNLKSSPTHIPAQSPLNSDSSPRPQDSGPSHNPPSHDVGINKLPGSWPHETQDNGPLDNSDQLHETFRAHEESLNHLRRSNSLVSANPAARLNGPFDPVRESYRSSHGSLPRRSATERQPNRPMNHGFQHHRMSHRRPRGDFRREEPSWESYLDRPRNLSGEPVPQPPNGTTAANTTQPEMEWPSTMPNSEEQRDPSISEPPARPKSKVDACVEHLKALGFLNDGEDVDQRLSVYASAVNGNLGDAIEMIEEERKAYEQQPSLV